MAWHDSFDRMKRRPHLLVVCPQAVASAWAKVVAGVTRGDFVAWEHQSLAAAWLRERHAGMLAMDMGTGKTFTALLALLTENLPLVFVDLSRGSSKARAEKLQNALATSNCKRLIVCINYEAVWRSQLSPTLESVKWSAIVLDESHRIKSSGGTASRYLARLAMKQPHAKRVCLTGTPMPHSPLDLFGQFRFIDPQVFGTSASRMRNRYAVCDARFPSKVRSWRNQSELVEKLDAHSWRVSADEVLDLPEAIHETIPVELSPAVRRFYNRLEREMVAEVEAGTVTVANAITKRCELGCGVFGVLATQTGVLGRNASAIRAVAASACGHLAVGNATAVDALTQGHGFLVLGKTGLGRLAGQPVGDVAHVVV